MSNLQAIQTKIESARNGKESNEVIELNLDNCQTDGEIVGLNDEFSSLKSLSIVNAGLTSLKGFPKLLKLQKLDLSGNLIDGSLSGLSNCVSLSHLDLKGNKIDNIDALSSLADLKNLNSLNLSNCDITKLPDYREKVLKLIPSLKVLDGIDPEVNVKNNQDENGVADVKQIHVVKDDEVENEESDVEEESDESDDEEYGLSYLARDDIVDDDEEEDGDYEEEEDQDDEEIEDEDDNERGVKRKHEDDDDDDESS